MSYFFLGGGGFGVNKDYISKCTFPILIRKTMIDVYSTHKVHPFQSCSIIFLTVTDFLSTGVLISPWPEQERNAPMFLSEWRKFPSAPCLAGKKKT